jgi:hypothetical protein
MSQAQLREVVLAHSSSDTWEQAAREWSLVDVDQADEPRTCICGHFPIIHVNTIANSVNGNVLEDVGSCCIVQFMDERPDLVLKGFSRAAKGEVLNEAALTYARERGWIDAWAFQFYSDTMRKRNLSAKQAMWRERINRQVLERQEEARVRADLTRYSRRFGREAALAILREVGKAEKVNAMDPALYGAVRAACSDPLSEPPA